MVNNNDSLQIKLELSKDNNYTLKVNDRYLHSRYNPQKEAYKIIENNYKKGRLFILFGLGLGYLVESFQQMYDPEHDSLVVIEPSDQLFNFIKDQENINKLFQNENIHLLINPNNNVMELILGSLVEKHGGKVVFIDSPNYKYLFPDKHVQYLKQIKEFMYLNIVNINTYFAWSKNWQENWFLNLYNSIAAAPFSEIVKEQFSCPVIIASGGPSLTKQLPLLKQLQNKAIIICAGSTINSLLKFGIKPHILVIIDGAKINYEHYRDVDAIHDIPLFYPLIVYNRIVEFHKGKKVVFHVHKDHLSKIGNGIFQNDLGYANGGGSVATFCLTIAKQLSSGPICMIGQDLAFTNFQTHAEGNKLGKQLNKNDLLNSKNHLKVKGFFNDEVVTNYSFLSMKQTFESIIKSFDSSDIYNSTEGGVYINGAIHISFKEFINQFCLENIGKELETFLLKINNSKFNRNIIKESLNNFITTSKRSIDNITKSSDSILKLIEKINLDDQLTTVHDQLTKLEEKLKKLLETDLLEYIFMPTVFRVTHQFEEENEYQLVSKTRFLYQSIYDLSKIAKEWFLEVEKKLRDEEI